MLLHLLLLQNGRTPMDVVNPENHPVIQMLIAAGSQASRPGPAGLMRQSSQQPVGSPMAAAKGRHSITLWSGMGLPSEERRPLLAATLVARLCSTPTTP